MEKNLTTGLKKSISLWGAMSLVIGTVIGSGIYSVPASVLASTGTPTNALFAWLVGGIITIFSALTVAEIATIFSTDGGIKCLNNMGFCNYLLPCNFSSPCNCCW